MPAWWNEDHHIVEGFERMEVQLEVGGRIIDHGAGGASCSWARVLEYDPPHRFVFSWEIDPQWKIEPDPSRASEVCVTFVSDGPARTTVTLEHRHLDRHGEGWEQTPMHRFRHSESYLRREAERVGLAFAEPMECTLRHEGSEPVEGFAVALHKPIAQA